MPKHVGPIENLLSRVHTEVTIKPNPSPWDKLLKELLPKSQPAAKAASKLQAQLRGNLERKKRMHEREAVAAAAAEKAAAERAEAEAAQAAAEEAAAKQTAVAIAVAKEAV